MTQDLLKRLREAGNDYTVAWGSGDLYDDAAAEIERLTAVLARIRGAIAADRCDGDTEYAAGVNAACRNHLELIDGGRCTCAGPDGPCDNCIANREAYEEARYEAKMGAGLIPPSPSMAPQRQRELNAAGVAPTYPDQPKEPK